MEIVQIVLDKQLLTAADRAAKRMRRNRSEFVREALRQHLRRLEVRAQEDRDREAYAEHPQSAADWSVWEAEAAWPAE